MPFRVEFAESVKEQLRKLTANERAKIFASVEKQLLQEPLKESRNRKPLRPNPIAPWELRTGGLRVFYEISTDQPDTVRILAVGKKRGNQLLISGKVLKL